VTAPPTHRGPTRPWTPEDRRRAVALWRSGLSVKATAKAVGYSWISTQNVLCEELQVDVLLRKMELRERMGARPCRA